MTKLKDILFKEDLFLSVLDLPRALVSDIVAIVIAVSDSIYSDIRYIYLTL